MQRRVLTSAWSAKGHLLYPVRWWTYDQSTAVCGIPYLDVCATCSLPCTLW